MKTARLILYRTPVVITLQRVGFGARNENPPMNRSEFVLYQGADAAIEFVVRDQDRKPINLLGKSLSLTVLEPRSETLVLTKRVRVLDPHKGTARVRFAPQDLLGVLPQHYVYSVLLHNQDGTSELLMTDQNTTARGVLEVRAGVLPQPIATVEIAAHPWEKLTPTSQGQPNTTRWCSGAYAATGPTSDPDGVHTLAVYSEGYRGRVRLQASLLAQPSAFDQDWFDVDLGTGGALEYNGESGLDAWTFLGHFQWVRVLLEPTMLNDGHISKILLRN